jgi:hypothetical protein
LKNVTAASSLGVVSGASLSLGPRLALLKKWRRLQMACKSLLSENATEYFVSEGENKGRKSCCLEFTLRAYFRLPAHSSFSMLECSYTMDLALPFRHAIDRQTRFSSPRTCFLRQTASSRTPEMCFQLDCAKYGVLTSREKAVGPSMDIVQYAQPASENANE